MTSRANGANRSLILTLPRCGIRSLSRAEIERGMARGRALQGMAVRRAFAQLFRFLARSATSQRSSQAPASLASRRHSCC